MPSPFTFVRLSYHSGDWDAVDERMPANLLHSLVQYTKVPVEPREKVVALDSPELFGYPFCYLSGHRLVQFSAAEKKNFVQYVRNGGFVLVDDCNHDIDGLFARSFEEQMRQCFGPGALKKIAKTHPIYTHFFQGRCAEALAHLLLERAGKQAVDVVVAVIHEHEAAVAHVPRKVLFLSAGKLHQSVPTQVAEGVVEQLRAIQGHHFFLGVDGNFGVLH